MALNLKSIDLNLLVIFEAVYSTGNISHAAKRLNMSQPAVSNALARLRHYVDDPLFVRASRGVEPTSKARDMIVPVRSALGLIEQHFEAADIDLATYQRVFRIMIIDPVEPFMMPPILRRISEEAPGIGIESLPASASFADDLRSGKLDVACLTYPLDTTDIVIKPLGPIELVMVARRGHPAIRGKIDRETFTSLGQIALTQTLRGMTHVDKDLVAGGVERRVVYMAGKVWSIPPLVERTDLISFLPRRYAEEMMKHFAIQAYPLPRPISEQHMYLTWHINSEHDAGHRWLRQAMMSALREDRETQEQNERSVVTKLNVATGITGATRPRST
jgi:DNA-binding transcriptional LysR family regulator